MDNIITVLVLVAGSLLILIYYFSIFRQLMKTPMRFLCYLVIWLIIIYSLLTIVEKIYFEKIQNYDGAVENKNLI